MKQTLLTLFVAIILAACAPAASPEAWAPEPSVVQPLHFDLLPQMTAIGRYNPPGAGAAITLTTGAQVTNPNAYPVRLQAIDYQVYLGNHPAGSARLAQELLLEPFASGRLTFEVEIDLRGQPILLRQVADAFAGAPLRFRFDGTLTLATLGYEPNLGPYTLLEGTAYAARTVSSPELRLDELESRVFMLEPEVPVVRVVARARNPGEIGYFLYGTDLQLVLDGHTLAFGDMRPSPLPAGGMSRLEIFFYPDLDRLDADARAVLERALAGLPVTLEIRGDLWLDVLGIDTYAISPDWQLSGVVAGEQR